MIIYPAIDLRGGRCVRLVRGDPHQETVFGEDPATIARLWAEQGAVWLHVVNLDGAFQSQLGTPQSPNLKALQAILHAVEIGVQFGGGVRSMDDIELLMEMGVDRVILGTAAVSRPQFVQQAIAEFGPHAIAVGIDARKGHVVTHGWRKDSHHSPEEFGRRMAKLGVKSAIFTDVSRDGTLEGANVDAAARLARETGLKIILSGGVASLDDIRAAIAQQSAGIAGIIVGRALYTGQIELPQALAIAGPQED